MNTPPILGQQSRCVIYCSRATFDKYPSDWQRLFLKPIVESAGGDYDSTCALGIIKGKQKVFIAFDYKNPKHISTCEVLGFRVKKVPAFKQVVMPTDYVHSIVNRWLEENKLLGTSFPREEEV